VAAATLLSAACSNFSHDQALISAWTPIIVLVAVPVCKASACRYGQPVNQPTSMKLLLLLLLRVGCGL
jgi:hypothetical protein